MEPVLQLRVLYLIKCSKSGPLIENEQTCTNEMRNQI